jgi:hypothetical protein
MKEKKMAPQYAGPARMLSLLLLSLFCLPENRVQADPPKVEVLKPEIKSTAPKAVQAGRTTTLLIYGENLTTKEITVAKLPVKVKLLELKATDPKLKLPGSKLVSAEVTVGAECPPESVELTLVQADGTKVTTPLVVVQNVAQEVTVKKPVETFKQAMPVPGPSVAIVGQLNGNVPDLFRLDAKAGETWNIVVTAGRMGSLMDPILRLRDSRHIPLALSAGDKKKDRLLVFHVPADGAYYIELTEGESKGGAGYDYRLTLVKK